MSFYRHLLSVISQFNTKSQAQHHISHLHLSLLKLVYTVIQMLDFAQLAKLCMSAQTDICVDTAALLNCK